MRDAAHSLRGHDGPTPQTGRATVGRRTRTRLQPSDLERFVHYRNGREAKNGDKVVSLTWYGEGPVSINGIGILYDAKPGNDYCNGSIASIVGGPVVGACLCDCLHVDDLAELLRQAGLDRRPPGK